MIDMAIFNSPGLAWSKHALASVNGIPPGIVENLIAHPAHVSRRDTTSAVFTRNGLSATVRDDGVGPLVVVDVARVEAVL